MPAELTLSSSSIDELSPELRKQAAAYVTSRLAAGVSNDSFNVSGARKALEESSKGKVDAGTFSRSDINGVTAYESGRGGTKLLYIHGGGFVGGSLQSHGHIAMHFARYSGYHVVYPEYRLAPEHPFPAAFEDVDAILDAIDEPLVVAGDSVGGALALHLALRHRNRKNILALALMAPMLAFTKDTSEYLRTHARARQMIAQSVSAKHAEDPRLTPISADLSSLPPTLIQIGGADYVRTDGLNLALRAIEDAAPVILEHWPNMPHVWQRFSPDSQEATSSLNRASAFLSAHSRNTHG